jgi:hypothetical protein
VISITTLSGRKFFDHAIPSRTLTILFEAFSFHAGEKTGVGKMIFPKAFAGQNWTVVPMATAAGRAPPTSIEQQFFQLTLTGVVTLDFKGAENGQWRRDIIHIGPDLSGPAKTASSRFGVRLPPGQSGSDYLTHFQADQWAPHIGLSAMFNKDHSVNSGFEVAVWRPNPFFKDKDIFTGVEVSNLWSGAQADIAVRDRDAELLRLSYHMTVIGKFVFSPLIIG